MNNRKLLLYGSVSAVLLVAVIAIFLIKLFSPSYKDDHMQHGIKGELLYKAVPSDAVMLLDIKEISNFKPLVDDTTSFAYNLFSRDHDLVAFQNRIINIKGEQSVPVLYSLHYSSKNDVSVFIAVDIENLLSGSSYNEILKPFLQKSVKKYNETTIYRYENSLYLACYNDVVVASTSLYLLESSIRHQDNGTSIMDNMEFRTLHGKYGNGKCLYVNHHQIGKFFSGVMMRGFLKYSDFFLRFASWSCFNVEVKEGMLALDGVLTNNSEEKYNSSVLYSQIPLKSSMNKILPSQTVFAISISLSDVDGYLNANNLFLEVHKKLGRYEEKQRDIGIKDKATPMGYVCDSLNIEELVAAYCKFGESYGWITLIKEKRQFDIVDVVGNVISPDTEIKVEPYLYKGYIESVFGEAFSHCNEESYCRIGEWQIIGPNSIITDYALGNANYTTLDYYLAQTPVKDFFNKEGIVKIAVNLGLGKDSVVQVVKPYYAKLINNSLEYKNFEFAVVNITAHEKDIVADASLYAIRMGQLPLPKPREELVTTTFVDSTIVVDNSSFELKNFIAGGKWYMEQLPNNKLRLLDGKRKGLWTIPFDTPICGAIEQVDFFKNGKLQMLFISGNKLYLLDRTGRFVRGFPVTLPKSVVLGPKVFDIAGNKDYSFTVLNDDNTVSIYKLTREKMDEGIVIESPDYIKELPQLTRINSKDYLLLKTVQRLRIYGLNGEEIVIKDKKRAIDANSGIEVVAGNEIKVTGIDGKEFIVDLGTGKTKKMN